MPGDLKKIIWLVVNVYVNLMQIKGRKIFSTIVEALSLRLDLVA